MAKYTRIASDRITEVVTNSYQEVIVELENIDLSFIFNLEPEEVARNCDLQKVLDYLDDDFVRAYVTERFGIIM